MIRVVIAEDHHLVRQGIRALLEKQPDIVVVGEAQNGFEAINIIEIAKPDIAILDINMPLIGGLEVIKEIESRKIPTFVLMLSMYSDETLIAQAFRYGAKGYLLKRSVTEELTQAIQEIIHGHQFISPIIEEEHKVDIANISKYAYQSNVIDSLTHREIEVLRMISEGNTNYTIGINLEISVKTVEKHRTNLMRKMGVQDVAGLIQRGIKLGLIFLEG